jgi:hypothetical protein
VSFANPPAGHRWLKHRRQDFLPQQRGLWLRRAWHRVRSWRRLCNRKTKPIHQLFGLTICGRTKGGRRAWCGFGAWLWLGRRCGPCLGRCSRFIADAGTQLLHNFDDNHRNRLGTQRSRQFGCGQCGGGLGGCGSSLNLAHHSGGGYFDPKAKLVGQRKPFGFKQP